MWSLLTSQLDLCSLLTLFYPSTLFSHVLILCMLFSFAWDVFPSPIKPNKHPCTLIFSLSVTSLQHLLRGLTVFLPPTYL